MIGTLYDVSVNRKQIKEYDLWRHMLERCYDDKLHERRPRVLYGKDVRKRCRRYFIRVKTLHRHNKKRRNLFNKRKLFL